MLSKCVESRERYAKNYSQATITKEDKNNLYQLQPVYIPHDSREDTFDIIRYNEKAFE